METSTGSPALSGLLLSWHVLHGDSWFVLASVQCLESPRTVNTYHNDLQGFLWVEIEGPVRPRLLQSAWVQG